MDATYHGVVAMTESVEFFGFIPITTTDHWPAFVSPEPLPDDAIYDMDARAILISSVVPLDERDVAADAAATSIRAALALLA
jgi:hypothetical protein